MAHGAKWSIFPLLCAHKLWKSKVISDSFRSAWKVERCSHLHIICRLFLFLFMRFLIFPFSTSERRFLINCGWNIYLNLKKAQLSGINDDGEAKEKNLNQFSPSRVQYHMKMIEIFHKFSARVFFELIRRRWNK